MANKNITVPKHLGIILDGNRRWAKQNGLAVPQGHKIGYQNLKAISKAAFEHGVSYLSAYVFSSENRKRDPKEVNYIMKLGYWAAINETKEFHKENIRLRVIGSKDKLDKKMITAISSAEKLTRNNNKGTLLLCLDYGGHQEIVNAARQIAKQNIKPESITAETIEGFLYAPDVPFPDLIIRPGGERRLSNFLTWQSAYSELYFSQKNWPEFNEDDLAAALKDYDKRQRRFGK